MELRDYIELGIRLKGSVKQLADHLEIESNNLTGAKAHRRGLPAHACVKLSDLLKVDLKTIIAASELATERKEEKRAFWLPFVTNNPEMGRLAKLVVILGIVTNLMTPHPSEAAQNKDSAVRSNLYYVKSKIILMLYGFFSKSIEFFLQYARKRSAAASGWQFAH